MHPHLHTKDNVG
jgi:COX assembly protein 2